ncbi:MAG: AarF/ABC1/UbiB kinase family protein [Fimbriimonadaceae bacterium]|nr:AarF/ABC1/UbiB kinase family protein [Fimbriimonadaceae bacterium]
MDNPALNGRSGEIARVLARNGFAWMWSKWKIGAVLGAERGDRTAGPTSPRTQPERLRKALEELGTTFIKIGQMLSTRPDLVPPEYLAELSKLQDDAPRVPYPEIADVIEREFGQAPERLFRTFDPEARAAGSVAQVHGATLPEGTPVVVKVRRPGIERLVELDLAVLGRVARFLSQHTELGRTHDLESLVEEFAHTIRGELDLSKEGQNAERIAAQFSEDPRLHVPRIHGDFSGRTVLTMEDVRGIKIDRLEALDAAGIDRQRLAETCTHVALVQVLEHGFFHADPHPGNLLVLSDGTVALLDYGMVGRVGDRLRASLVRLALAVARQDAERLFEELLSLGAAKRPIDRDAVLRDLERLMERYDGVPLGQISAAVLFRELSETARRHDLRLPSDLVLLARVVAMDEGIGAHLAPKFRFMEFARPYFEDFWRKSHSLGAVSRRLKEEAVDLVDLGDEMPRRLRRLMSTVERGELTTISRLDVPDALIGRLQDTANRVAVSTLLAGIIVGLSVLASYRRDGPESYALTALLAVAVAMGAWLLGAFWRSARPR